MAWTFYDANGNSLQLTGAHTLASHSGTLAIASGGTASVNVADALEALGVGPTDSPEFTTLTLRTGLVPDASDGATLGTAALEFSDLFLADAAVINLGDDQDVTFTHVADTGVLLNSSRKIQFGDAGTFIHQSADGVLTITSDTTVDINGAVVFDGALTGITNITLSGTLSDGNYTFDTNGNVSGLGTIGSGAITSTGAIIGTQVDILAQGDLRLQDTSGNQYVALQAAGTTTTHTLTFPAAVATTAGDVLSSSTGGVLSWTTPSAGVGIGLVIALGG
jgi:hypothetical protein